MILFVFCSFFRVFVTICCGAFYCQLVTACFSSTYNDIQLVSLTMGFFIGFHVDYLDDKVSVR